MNCQEIEQRMMDVLYGEALDSRQCFAFFQHLEKCADCRREYDELVDTRRRLAEWQVDDLPAGALQPAIEEWKGSSPAARGGTASVSFWTWVQRSAAALLMVLGLWTVLAQTGLTAALGPAAEGSLSDAQLRQRIEEEAAMMAAEEIRSLKMQLQDEYEFLLEKVELIGNSADEHGHELRSLHEQIERYSSGT
ncbi:MAG TPA: zf-HC2 domain-containing protein [Acidobacteriota bacterium]|nr:zf-HC2 domain-containing protein [Acidobacteriota bacterium]